MRRKMCLLLPLLLCLMAAAALGEGQVEISTPEQLQAIREAPDGSYVLMDNLDLDGILWEPFLFSGELDGNGYTIANLQVTQVGSERRETKDGNLKGYDTGFAGLFSVMERATVKNLHLLGARIEVREDEACFAGILAGCMEHSTVDGCSVQGQVFLSCGAMDAGIGGLVGYGSGLFQENTADVELIYEDRFREGRCEMFLGGVLGCGIGDFLDNSVTIDGYNSCFGYMHAGGLVGMYYECGMDYPRGEVIRNSVKGRIIFFEDQPDARSYCKAMLGEALTKPLREYGNKDSFKRPKVWTSVKTLLPEECDVPDIQVRITEPGDTEWGYTEHTCLTCGYTYRDHWRMPGSSTAP
ncbi:MAG: hypothetical protein IJ083_07690 [Clostridia bacterium]|nr:hypothetical protein [Clostridia bacterium]